METALSRPVQAALPIAVWAAAKNKNLSGMGERAWPERGRSSELQWRGRAQTIPEKRRGVAGGAFMMSGARHPCPTLR